jgi:hypothetical protein
MTTRSLFIMLFIVGTVATADAQYSVPSTPMDTTGAEAVQLCQVIIREGGQCPTAAPLSELYAHYRRLMDAKWSAYRPERKQQRQQEESKESLQGSAKITRPEQQLPRNSTTDQLRADLEKTRKELDSVSRDAKRIAANVEELLKVVNALAGEVASLKSELEALRTKRK